MVRPAIAPHPLPVLSARQLNRTTLLRQSLLERSAEDTLAAVRRLGGLQARYANSPYLEEVLPDTARHGVRWPA